tara:strand:- start:410 stop:619 length:210 start_codon:yes stop_codon:yes gene_type:complete
MFDEVDANSQVFVIPYGKEGLRICVDDNSIYKPMTVKSYLMLIMGCIESILDILKDEQGTRKDNKKSDE